MIDVDMTFKTSEHLALLNYSQADEDGVMVLVSRQAIHEVSAEITRLRDENEELKSQIVMECNEDEVPTFNQGLIEHELLEVVTAKRLDTLVALVVSLRARLAEAEAAKADAWDEGFNEGVGRDQDFYDLQHLNPYRSKTDE